MAKGKKEKQGIISAAKGLAPGRELVPHTAHHVRVDPVLHDDPILAEFVCHESVVIFHVNLKIFCEVPFQCSSSSRTYEDPAVYVGKVSPANSSCVSFHLCSSLIGVALRCMRPK